MIPPVNRYYFFALGLFILLVILFITVLTLSLAKPKETPITRIEPTRTQPLHQKEKAYNEAKPQEYYVDGSKKTGTLVVTASLPEVRIMIDDGDEEGPITSKAYPIQITPFRITEMPTGKHLLRAAKPGFLMVEIPFMITDDNVTRIQVSLQPIRPVK